MKERIRQLPRPVIAAIVGVLVLASGAAAAVVLSTGDGGSGGSAQTIIAGGGETVLKPEDPKTSPLDQAPALPSSPRELQARLVKAAAAAAKAADAAHRGSTAVAIAVGPDAKPTAVGNRPAAPFRMWSTSKPVTAIAAFRAGADDKDMETAIDDAIIQSSNCAQRRVVLGLQQLVAGNTKAAPGPEALQAANRDFESVIAEGGSGTSKAAQSTVQNGQVAGLDCSKYFATNPVPKPQTATSPAMLFGTAEWTVTDAASFARGLAAGKLGKEGERVLGIMREPKQADPLTPPDEYTVDHLDWGAGRAFEGLDPAYKAGWGGSQSSYANFSVSQMVSLTKDRTPIGIAVHFRPDAQPPLDDPGKTTAPDAIEAVLLGIRRELLSPPGAGR